MSKREYKIYDYNYDYQELLNNQIKVNKRQNITNTLCKYNIHHKMNTNINNKDNLYYNIDKKSKTQKNKIPLSLNKKNIKKVSEIETKYELKHITRGTFKKKTINTYSNENRTKEGNIIEDLQNNKYLRPMLCTTNINNKLLKCQIQAPIKNIITLSLRNYINKNIDLPVEEDQFRTKNNNDISDEGKINTYKNTYSVNATKDDIYQLNKNIRYTDSVLRMQKKKCFFSEERKEKDREKVKRDSKNEIYNYYNKIYVLNSPNNNMRNKNLNINNNYIEKYIEKKNIYEIKNNNNSKDNKLLQIYKNKLIEEFIIVLNKFISKHLNKNKSFFFKNLMKHKDKSKSKNKIYFKKKNNDYNKKRLTTNENLNKLKYTIENEKEKEKTKYKATTDTSANFNLNNKSFSNEKKSTSISNNILSNLSITNNRLYNNQSSSFLFTYKKHKNYSQSPEEVLIPQNQIKTKTIIYKKDLSRSPNKSLEEQGRNKFVYKKKNLNSENIYMNKINNFDLNNFYSNNNINNKNDNYLLQKTKGKIIDIDINLGKPISSINDQSHLEELFLENNEPFLFKLNTISSKFMNKNKKKNKAKSGSKNKIKPPLRLKRFAEEENEEEVLNDYFMDNYKPYYTLKKNYENNLIDFKFENNLKELNKININLDSSYEDKENIIESDKLHIRHNYFHYNGFKYRNNNNFKNLVKENNISLAYTNKKQYENKNKIDNSKNKRKKVNKLYINCTKFFINALNRIIKKNIFIIIFQIKK